MRKKKISTLELPGYFFILPALVLLLVVTIFPYFYAVFLSFQETKFGTLLGFCGLNNYINVIQNSSFRTVIINQVLIIVFSGCLQFLLGFAGALALNRATKLTYALRSMALVPWVIPGVVCGLLWKWIFDGNAGVLNLLLGQYIPWLTDRQLALTCVILVNVWRVFPFMMVMYLSALQSIPMEQYEAALVDGANSRQRLIHITIPNMKPIIAVTLILSTIWNFKIFDIIWTLTKGGPAGATDVFSTLIYKSSFYSADFGFSSAVAVIMAVIITIPIVFYLKLSSNKARRAG